MFNDPPLEPIPRGIPDFMCNLDTVAFESRTVINELAGDKETWEVAGILQRQRVVGLGIQCNAGEQGIHAISVATVEHGVFVYILADRWLPNGLWRLLRNSNCTKVICNINEHLIQRVCDCFRLPDLWDDLHDIGDYSVQSAAQALGLRVFWPKSRDFHNYSQPNLDAGHQGYLAVNALVPLLVAADRQILRLDRQDYSRMRDYFTMYDINEGSRAAVLARQSLARLRLVRQSSARHWLRGQNASEKGTSDHETSDNGTPDDGTPDDETSGEETSADETPDDGTSGEETSADEASGDEAPSEEPHTRRDSAKHGKLKDAHQSKKRQRNIHGEGSRKCSRKT